jgi:hypothetical protein
MAGIGGCRDEELRTENPAIEQSDAHGAALMPNATSDRPPPSAPLSRRVYIAKAGTSIRRDTIRSSSV